MTLENLVSFNNLPEYALDNMWFIEIIDDKPNNTVLFYDIDGKFDSYVSEVNIPQESLKFEKTSFGVPIFDDQEEYDNITLTFYDDTDATMSKFFQDWLDSIYDRKKRQLKLNWRYQSKTIKVYLVKIYNKSTGYNLLLSTMTNVASQINTLLNQSFLDNVEHKVFATYELENCFPTSLEPISLSSDGGDRLQFTVTLECERMNPYYNYIE